MSDPTASATESIDEPRDGLALLGVRRFLPFFLTQFLGAFNDNAYRNALIGLLTFQMATVSTQALDTATLILLAQALFIFPFFVFSSIAGQMADKFDKARLIRVLKLSEILIMLVAALALYTRSLPLLLGCILATGAQSAFFGPAKYGILPMHLHSDELTGANALVQSGTMVAILAGTIAGGLVTDIDVIGPSIIAVFVVVIAGLGWLASRSIPPAPPHSPQIRLNYNIVAGTWGILLSVRDNRPLLLAVLGISWFWFFGSIMLAQLPVYVRDVLQGEQVVYTLLLATFTIGIVAGAMLCDRMSGHRVEIGLVPLGAFGMAVFAADFSWISIPGGYAAADLGVLFSSSTGLHVVIALFGLALSAGLYIVPLYSMIQIRSDRGYVSRVIAFNNVLNALFTVAGSLIAIALLLAGLDIPQLVFVITLMHVAVVAFIFLEVPEFAMRLIVYFITHLLYRLKVSGIDNIPMKGPAVIVCNHVSLVDALVITSICRRPIRFVMYHKIFDTPLMNYLFRASKAIPIAPQKEDAELLQQAMDAVAETLAEGGLVGIFPEGRLSPDGELGEFKPGIERILERTPVPVVPMATRGLWGTFFSRVGGRTMSHWPRHWLSRIELNIGEPVTFQDASAENLREKVAELAGKN